MCGVKHKYNKAPQSSNLRFPASQVLKPDRRIRPLETRHESDSEFAISAYCVC